MDIRQIVPKVSAFQGLPCLRLILKAVCLKRQAKEFQEAQFKKNYRTNSLLIPRIGANFAEIKRFSKISVNFQEVQQFVKRFSYDLESAVKLKVS